MRVVQVRASPAHRKVPCERERQAPRCLDAETDMPSCDLERADPAPLEVVIRFELPAPIRVEKLLTTGFGLSRSAVKGMVDAGRIRLPLAIDAKAREDFTLFVITAPGRPAERSRKDEHFM